MPYLLEDFVELPIVCNELKSERDFCSYLDGEWTDDFGPWKKGDKFATLFFGYPDYRLIEYVDGNEAKSCFTKLMVDDRNE